MMRGGRGMDPRQMKLAMKRMGITTEELEGVEEVIIRMKDKERVIKAPQITIMTVQGQKTYQVVGESEEDRARGADAGSASSAPTGPHIPDEDIELVAAQAQVSHEEARAALEETGGEPAEAIIALMGRKKR
jgi:nascent polypeptide-associated complex subunit alpha